MVKPENKVRASEKEIAEPVKGNSSVLLWEILISLLFILGISYVTWYRRFANIIPEINFNQWSVIVILLLLVNPLLRLISKRLGFSQKNIVVIYLLVLVGVTIIQAFPYMAIADWMVFYHYTGVKEAKTGVTLTRIYGQFIDVFSPWILPQGTEQVAIGFSAGESVVPWNAWIRPAITWTIFMTLVTFVSVCIGIIVRKRWEEHEHLSYPLTIPILEMSKEDQGFRKMNSFWTNKLMWIGFAISAVRVIWGYLASIMPFFPSAPGINLTQFFYSIADIWAQRVGSQDLFQAMLTACSVHTWVIGLGYFISMDFLFSWWFFVIFARVENYVLYLLRLGRILGTVSYPYYSIHDFEAFGGFMAIVGLYAWLMRDELKRIFRSAIGKESNSEEGMSYRVAVFGGMIGLVVLMSFAIFMLKIRIYLAMLYFIVYYLSIFTLMRMRAEAGFPGTNGIGQDFPRTSFYPIFGSNLVGPNTVAGFNLIRSVSSGKLTGIPVALLDGWKMADTTKIKKSSLTKAVLLITMLTFGIAFATGLPILYRFGLKASINQWNWALWNGGPSDIFSSVAEEIPPNLVRLLVPIKGAIMAIFLGTMKSRFVWWPFHPLAYIGANCWGYYYTFLGGFFVAWFVKGLILRYGGSKGYKQCMPFFIGLLVGEFAGGTITSIISLILALLPR